MSLSRNGERGFIESLRRRFRDLAPPAPAGIGDDAAVVKAAGHPVLTTDALIADVHFRMAEPPRLLGRKALAVNLSDLAAMGVKPAGFLLVLAIPERASERYLDGLMDGLASAARQHGAPILGGDLCGTSGPLAITITAVGGTGRSARPVLTRAGARAGDGIWVSGALGASAAGRFLLDLGWRPRVKGDRLLAPTKPRGKEGIPPNRALDALRRHLDPEPRLELGARLRRERLATAAIDISDGLSTDLARLAEASGVGARVLEPAVPIHDAARACSALGADSAALALHGGEEYELLFTVPPSRERRMARIDAVLIGRILPRRRGIVLRDAGGRDDPLPAGGFDHFLARAPVRRGGGRGRGRARAR